MIAHFFLLASPALSAGPNLRRSRSPTCPIRRTVWSSTCAVPRPISKRVPTGRYSLRGECGDVPGPRAAPLAEGIPHQIRSPVPWDQPRRPRRSACFESRLDRLDFEASGAEGGDKDQATRRSFTPCWLRHAGGHKWSERTRHHAPDWAQVGGDLAKYIRIGQMFTHNAAARASEFRGCRCATPKPEKLGGLCRPSPSSTQQQRKTSGAHLREKGLIGNNPIASTIRLPPRSFPSLSSLSHLVPPTRHNPTTTLNRNGGKTP